MFLPITLSMLWSSSCRTPPPSALQPLAMDLTIGSLPVGLIHLDGASATPEALLNESWMAYRQRFIQADGRVIDWEAQARTVSEGQAYAMLRAVLTDDPDTFEQTLAWAETNLKRPALPNDADGRDRLWAWQWGQRADGTWGILDSNFASDADIDAITALILAARRWQRADYLELAQLKLDDLWVQAIVSLPPVSGDEPRYLLPGPIGAFQPRPGAIYLNPSYLAPYAFRLFAQVDPSRDWLALVESSYGVLEQSSQLSPEGLPSDWVVLNLADQTLETAPGQAHLQSRYGFDAYRVWWRLAWDAAWFEEPRAQALLAQGLGFLGELWQQQGHIPAVLTLAGQPVASYESTAHYAMLYLGFQQVDPDTAVAIYQQKLMETYSQGIWDSADAYYVQNLAWLGIYPANQVPTSWLRASSHGSESIP
jgi:endo-1,4-beta-D-glucanase Y